MEPVKERRNNISLSILFALILIGATAIGFTRNNIEKKPQEKTQVKKNVVNSDVVIYGTWSSENSEIKGVDVSTKIQYDIANLPSSIKKITMLPSNKLLFIEETDTKDHGKKLSTLNVNNQVKETIYSSDENFGIDDYTISNNKRYLAVWEVSFTESLSNGKSRVYTIDLLNPNIKNLIYDETANGSSPVHYPVAITDSGNVYLDSFLANTEAGWGHGMSFSNLTGTQKQDLSEMAASTYGTQPTLSPDGQSLLFAGYDGSFGVGSIMSTSDFRQAILRPNTVEILNLNTNKRQKLANLSNLNTYPSVFWNPITSNPVINVLSADPSAIGFFEYSLAYSNLTKISIQDYAIVKHLSNGKILAGVPEQSTVALGNLGDKYSSPVTSFYLFDTKNPNGNLICSEGFMQFIDVLSPAYFSTFNVSQSTKQNKTSKSSGVAQTLQLASINFKPELAPIRIGQQSKPRCRDLAAEQCIALGITDDSKLKKCVRQAIRELRATANCYDSPLYLYGNEGLTVKVDILTKTYPSSANSFIATLGKNGNFFVKDNLFESMDFSYRPAIKVAMPSYGKIVSKEKLRETLTEYGQKLGLNNKELSDLLKTEEKINSPFIFVSFFNHDQSSQILPIKFNPAPDNYRNIIFYFKKLAKDPGITIDPPIFSSIQRGGFTAVEISEIVE